MSDKSLKYESKCRRCGHIEEWHFMDGYVAEWNRLHHWVFEHANFPEIGECRVCNKTTLQDIVSYSNKPEK